MRHGEGFHNIGIVNEDAHLTASGWKQAHALRKHITSIRPALAVQARISRLCSGRAGPCTQILPSMVRECTYETSVAQQVHVLTQVVIVSPLMRALETAAGVFGGGAFEGDGRPLMLAQTELEDERAAHGAVACVDSLPFIAFEGCRERLGALGACTAFLAPVQLWGPILI